MGSENGDDDEQPVREVIISRDFYMGVYEVTQAQWERVMGTTLEQQSDSSDFQGIYGEGVDFPMYHVSWEDARAFAERLNVLEKCNACYRLPTEAEWEYAARAGTSTEYSFGDDVDQLGNYGWYRDNSGNETHPVGQKQPNPWGLYDIHGNVWEWVSDWYAVQYENGTVTDPTGTATGSNRVVRGGSWDNSAGFLRSAFRRFYSPGLRDGYLGFRLVRTYP